MDPETSFVIKANELSGSAFSFITLLSEQNLPLFLISFRHIFVNPAPPMFQTGLMQSRVFMIGVNLVPSIHITLKIRSLLNRSLLSDSWTASNLMEGMPFTFARISSEMKI